MDTLEPRVQRLEVNTGLLSQELQQMNKTLSKIEVAIEKQNEIHSDVRVLSQKFDSHISSENKTIARTHSRIDKLEANQTKMAWGVITMFLGILGALITKGVN